MASIRFFGLCGLCGPEFQKPFQIGDVVLNLGVVLWNSREERSSRMQTRRSRTEHWRDSLAEVKARGGTIECTLDGEEGGLTWRLRVWGLSEECVVVEAPTAFGHPLILDPGVRMRGTIAIGQNRWDFSTEVLSSHGDTLQLKAPSRVRRRRRVARTDLAPCPSGLKLRPLPSGVTGAAAERAWVALASGGEAADPALVRPVSAPPISVQLANIGVGGVGVIFESSDAALAMRRGGWWIEGDLPGGGTLVASAELVHRHMQSDRCLYAGLSFRIGAGQRQRRHLSKLVEEAAKRLQYSAA